MLRSVIMAGGSGTRFWPLSRKDFPKQFLAINSERSLIQQAFDRCQPWIPADQTWVVTGERLAALTQEHLPDVPASQILKEPAARNTAACVGLAALCLTVVDPDATMLVMPADHVIADQRLFESDIARAVDLVEEDPERLILFGIPPLYPATGFGYIERGAAVGSHGYQVASFREKPDRETAERYLAAGTFSWNAGIFVWKAKRILEALAKHEPDMVQALETLRPYVNTSAWDNELAKVFPTLKSISIDVAVLERESNIVVVQAQFPWDDVGGWEAMTRLLPQDANGNSYVGLMTAVDSSGCIVRSTPDHMVALLGIKNCIVVHTEKSTLIAQRGDDEAIRKLIAALQKEGHDSFL